LFYDKLNPMRKISILSPCPKIAILAKSPCPKIAILAKSLCAIILLFSLTQCSSQKIENNPILLNAKGYKTASYKIRGIRYTPMTPTQCLNYKESGIASHYEGAGGQTSMGIRPRRGQLYAAHKTLPLPCVVRVTCLESKRSVELRVIDRGPFIKNRIIDVSATAARQLGFHSRGLKRVSVELISVGEGKYKHYAKKP